MSTGEYVCNACGGIHVGGGSCYALNARYQYHEAPSVNVSAPTITVPRDQYELYKEAAEMWAKEQETRCFASPYEGEMFCQSCDRIMLDGNVHAADCKAARILGLKREGRKVERQMFGFECMPAPTVGWVLPIGSKVTLILRGGIHMAGTVESFGPVTEGRKAEYFVLTDVEALSFNVVTRRKRMTVAAIEIQAASFDDAKPNE